jgi:hypothetical protein
MTGLLGRIIRPLQGRCLNTWQHKHGIDAHRYPCFNGFRAYDPSVRASEDSSCLRPRGHCFQPMKFKKQMLCGPEIFGPYTAACSSRMWVLSARNVTASTFRLLPFVMRQSSLIPLLLVKRQPVFKTWPLQEKRNLVVALNIAGSRAQWSAGAVL